MCCWYFLITLGLFIYLQPCLVHATWAKRIWRGSKKKPTTSCELRQRTRRTSHTTTEQEINRRSSEAELEIKSIPKTVRHLEGDKVLEGTNDLFMNWHPNSIIFMCGVLFFQQNLCVELFFSTEFMCGVDSLVQKNSAWLGNDWGNRGGFVKLNLVSWIFCIYDLHA
jgi:hypothetical protein